MQQQNMTNEQQMVTNRKQRQENLH